LGLSRGSRLGPYEILAPLGAGGMGEVYRAHDPRLNRDVAIKVLPASFSTDAGRLRRFEQEARAAGSLSHPNITAVYDVGIQDGSPYVVQELLEGETLREILSRGRLPAKRAIEYAAQIAQGLATAHEKGIVHRDLKPANLFVTKDGRVKILDFGLAKLTLPETGEGSLTEAPTLTADTDPGVVVGTVGYMAPEQIRGQPVDGRSDIFVFGAILYEMLSGQRAFLRNSPADTMSAILKEEPAELSGSLGDVPAALERVLRHCLEKQPDDRFQSARDISFALSEASAPISAGVARPADRATASRKTAVVAVVVVALLAAAGVLLLSRTRIGGGEAGGVKRVAVLPFENLGSAEDDYFADGMADAVRGKLTSLPGIEVIARGSSVSYKKTSKTLRQIAGELGAPYLLTATVRWEKGGGGSRVRVSPELVRVRDSGVPTSKWQQAFDAPLTDVFEVQSEIAGQVAHALGVALGAAEEKRLSERPTQNLDAYDAYLRGIENNHRFYMKEAKADFERALSLDPDFAMAMVRLATFSSREEARVLIERASQRRDRLSERDRLWVDVAAANQKGNREEVLRATRTIHAKYPDDVDAAMILSAEEFNLGRGERAIQILSELLAVDPRNSQIYNQLAYYSAYRGEYDKAMEYLKKYQSLEPGHANPYDSLGEIQAYSGRYDEAIANLNRGLSLKPDFYESYLHLGVAYEGKGEYARAIQNYEKAARDALTDDRRKDCLIRALLVAVRTGDRAATREVAALFAAIPSGEDYEIFRAFTDAALDIVEGRNAEAERRLTQSKPKLLGRWENSFKGSGRKPHFPTWNAVMALVRTRQGRDDDAIALYESNANPPNPWQTLEERRMVYEARAELAALIARKGDLDRAERLLAENRKWNPSWAPTRPAELAVERLRRERGGSSR
jgi:TolB-like protein/Flp pilus assembly protein TadD